MGSINSRIIIIVLIITAVGMGALAGTGAVFSLSAVKTRTLERVAESARLRAEETDGWLDKQAALVNALAGTLSVYPGAGSEAVAPLLEKQTEASGVLGARVAYPSGTAATGGGSEPYSFKWEGGKLVLTVPQVFYRDGVAAGVIEMDFDAGALNDIIAANVSAGDSLAFLTDAAGNILASPTAGFAPGTDNNGGVAYTHIYEIENGNYSIAARDGSFTEFKDANGETVYFTCRETDNNGWRVYESIPSAAVSLPVRDMIIVTGAVFLLTLLVMAAVLYITLNSLITEPAERISGALKLIAGGSLGAELPRNFKGEMARLAEDAARADGVLLAFTDELTELNRKIHSLGEYEYEANTDKLTGAYKTAAASVNSLANGFRDDVASVLRAAAEISGGNFGFNFKRYPGGKAFINDACDALVKNMREIQSELIKLTKDASTGRLKVDANPNRRGGGWAEIFTALENLFAAASVPIREAGEVLGEMVKGNLDAKVKGDYGGEFNNLTDDVNTAMNAARAYADEITEILRSASSGKLDAAAARKYAGYYAPVKETLTTILQTLEKSLAEIYGIAGHVPPTGTQTYSVDALTVSVKPSQPRIRRKKISAAQNRKKHPGVVRSQLYRERAAETKRFLEVIKGITESSADISRIGNVIGETALQTGLVVLKSSPPAAMRRSHLKKLISFFHQPALELKNFENKN